MKSDHEAQINQQLGNRAGRGTKLLARLFHQPVISVNEVAGVIQTTYPPANELVNKFGELGYLVEVTGQKRNRFFRYQPYIDILQRDRTPASASS